MKKTLLTTGLVGILMVGAAAPAIAFEDTASTPLPGTGAKVEANAWQCSTYFDKCSFKTSTKALKGSAKYKVSKITNTATVKANGWQATLSLSPSGTQVSENTRQVSWTNKNTWISDISGIADPGGSLNTSVTTCSDGGAFTAGVKAFASACAND
ncbi:hypothetical protein EJ357_22270 [Streptomyces cyaneochromogenes]|uniref:Uncharacterized protein n=1 Tax=Streptomyces cyaneochromogenes TaxID=2496836 RepID=A0A3S9M9M6_9ACTN|nr:hypothetical protein [Streptomyces cyaneochromogenes]AZQ35874.1 hypothetical protein EJ357_22270 [Streptomyces cyaneochromogenes]